MNTKTINHDRIDNMLEVLEMDDVASATCPHCAGDGDRYLLDHIEMRGCRFHGPGLIASMLDLKPSELHAILSEVKTHRRPSVWRVLGGWPATWAVSCAVTGALGLIVGALVASRPELASVFVGVGLLCLTSALTFGVLGLIRPLANVLRT